MPNTQYYQVSFNFLLLQSSGLPGYSQNVLWYCIFWLFQLSDYIDIINCIFPFCTEAINNDIIYCIAKTDFKGIQQVTSTSTCVFSTGDYFLVDLSSLDVISSLKISLQWHVSFALSLFKKTRFTRKIFTVKYWHLTLCLSLGNTLPFRP